MDMATLWQTCLQFEYDRERLVEGLDKWLGGNKDLRILDAACGSGFPSLDLIKRGYRVTCADGSESMLAAFRRNATSAGLTVVPHCMLWADLSRYFAGEFDVVMCRGSSLIYAGAWESERIQDRSAMWEALRSFADCVAPGGVLYVDTTSEANLELREPEHNSYEPRVIDGNKVELSEVVSTDRVKRVRTWKSMLKVNGVSHEITRYSHYLPHAELIEMLEAYGLRNIRKEKVQGEHYTVFVAENSQDSIGALARESSRSKQAGLTAAEVLE
jgi:SAM-dependent methyltransferase